MNRLRGLLAAGAGSLVVASAVVVTAPATASTVAPARSVIERVEAVRAQLALDGLMRAPGDAPAQQLAWHAWNNWENYQYQDQVWNNVPSWHNVGYRAPEWTNWHNWHDWGNNHGDWGNKY